MTTQIKAGVIAANAVNSSELASGALSGQNFTGDVTFDTTTLVIDSSNNRVGIGIDSPTNKLEIVGAKTLIAGIPTNNISVTDSTSLAANTGGAINFSGVYQTGGATTAFASIEASKETATHNEYGGALVFKTRQDQGSQNEHMRITSTGNVGIGESNPDAPLHITSNTPIISFDESDAGQEYRIGSFGGAFALYDSTDSAYRLVVDGSGNVGIGVTSILQGYKLEVDGNIVIPSGNILANRRADGGNFGLIRGNDSGTTILGDYQSVHILSSGNVGIGDSSPAAKLEIKQGSSNWYEGIRINRSDNTTQFGTFSNNSGATFIGAADTTGGSNNALLFGNSTDGTTYTERMRIDSDGIMLLGTTTRSIGTAGDVNKFGVAGGSNSVFPMVVFADQDTSVEGSSIILELSYDSDVSYTSANYALFSDQTATQGSISGTGDGTVAYNTSSDSRLKENIVDTTSQLDKVKQIQVRDFNYIGNDTTTTGMIAQELNEIIPNVVVEGQEDFKRHPWGIDYGKLTPYLIKAIQEQQTIIDDLKSRLDEAGL